GGDLVAGWGCSGSLTRRSLCLRSPRPSRTSRPTFPTCSPRARSCASLPTSACTSAPAPSPPSSPPLSSCNKFSMATRPSRAVRLFKLRQAETSEGLGEAIAHGAQRGGQVRRGHLPQDVDHRVAQRRQHLRRHPLAHPAGVFPQGHVAPVGPPVRDPPV